MRAELQMRAAAEMLAISLRPLGKRDPEEFYMWTNMKIMIIILEINVSEGGMGCGGTGVSAVSSSLNRNSPVALAGTVGTRAEGTGFGCQHPPVPQSLLVSEFRGSERPYVASCLLLSDLHLSGCRTVKKRHFITVPDWHLKCSSSLSLSLTFFSLDLFN